MNLVKDLATSVKTNADFLLTAIKCLEKIESELRQEKSGPAAKHLKFRIEQLEFQKREWTEKIDDSRKRLKESYKMLEVGFEKEVGQKTI